MVSAALKLSLGEKNIDMVLDFLRDRSIAHHHPKRKRKGGSGRVKASGEGLSPPYTLNLFKASTSSGRRIEI